MLALAACASAIGPTWAAARPILGAEVDLTALPPDQRPQLLDRLAAAGVSSLRMPLDWNQVEPKPGSFRWAQADAAVDLARARGLDVVLILGPCATWAVDPAWEVPEGEGANSVPRSNDDWRDYVAQAVSHFRGRVTYWQVRRQPNIRNFRGAREEYEALLDVASKAARAADPAARIVVPEAGHLGVASVADRVSSPNRSFDVIGLYPPAEAEESLLPWSVIVGEVLPGAEASRRSPVWVLGGGDEPRPAEAWRAHYLIAWAFGAERCYLPPEAIDPSWYGPLASWTYVGFATPEKGVWAFVFDTPEGRAAYACGATGPGTPAGTSDLPVQTGTEGGAAEEAAPPSGGQQAAAAVSGPLVMQGAACPEAKPGAPTRADVLAARDGLNLSQVPLVYLDCSLPQLPEFGLYNRSLRRLGGGAVCEADQGRGRCLQTKMAFGIGEEDLDNPWLYFDVDDRWLYYDRGESRLAITVECEGAYMGDQKLGLNIYYDGTRGYRFTPWQWVDKGYERHTYRFLIDDASFADRDGYDFRINAEGSKQDLSVFSVTVEKLPSPAAPAGAEETVAAALESGPATPQLASSQAE